MKRGGGKRPLLLLCDRRVWRRHTHGAKVAVETKKRFAVFPEGATESEKDES